jgi:hypothetical protein
MNAITRFDTAALNRALVGFDRLFDTFEHRFANQVQNNYPPHNVVFLFYSCDAHSVVFLVLGRHQVVLADILVAATRGVTFTKLKHLV